MLSISIINRLRLLQILPMLIILMGSLYYGNYLYSKMESQKNLTVQVDHIQQVAVLIHELQKERALCSSYLGQHGKFHRELLEKQRRKVDEEMHRLYRMSSDQSAPFATQRVALERLGSFRNQIDSLQVSPLEACNFYTQIIGQMRTDYLTIVMTVSDISLRNDFQAYTNLMAIKETLGQIQSTLNAIFFTQRFNNDLYIQLLLSKGEYDTAESRFETLASNDVRTAYHKTFSGKDVEILHRIIFTAITNHDTFRMNPATWFDISSSSIDKLRGVEQYYFSQLQSKLTQRVEDSYQKLVMVIFILLVTFMLMVWFGYHISEGIRRNIKLLDEYKNAVDRSSIVSKTDRKGRIIYANDKFCSISGYSREELIGKPHSMVRHETMPKQVFKDMWDIISQGQAWHGVVKNRTKSGSYYWVDATINPILDHKGNIEEFIAIRSDITETIRLHSELEQTQQEMIARIGEIGETRSRETGFHVRRVAEYSRLLAQKYGLNDEEASTLANASPMHDIGKVGIPDHILNKPGPLTSDEWEVMRTHCKIGYDLFRDSERPLLQAAAIIAYEHHEKYDGSGYPRGLKGESIHIFGRITALADVFDALGSDRCYKKAWETEKILSLLKEERGRHFDPVLIDLFFEHLDEFLAIRDAYGEKNICDARNQPSMTV